MDAMGRDSAAAMYDTGARRWLVGPGRAAAIAVACAMMLGPGGALAQPTTGGADTLAKPGAWASVNRGYYWANNDLMRMYESIRSIKSLETRYRIFKRMQVLMEDQVRAREEAISFHYSGKVPVRCKPGDWTGEYHCLARSMALSHVYYGMAKSMLGFDGSAQKELHCARKLFPEIEEAEIFLRRPPRSRQVSLRMRIPTEKETVKVALKTEARRWSKAAHKVTYRVSPEPRAVQLEKLRFSGAPIELSRAPVIEPALVEDGDRWIYARMATELLRQTLKRLYRHHRSGRRAAELCPDQKVLYLPRGRWVLYSTRDRRFPQNFEITGAGDAFTLELFSSSRAPAGTGGGGTVTRVAWYPNPCIGPKCKAKKPRPEPKVDPRLVQVKRERYRKSVWSYSALATGLALAAGAATLYGVGSSRGADAFTSYQEVTATPAEDRRDEVAQYRKGVEDSETMMTVGHVLISASVAALGYSLYSYLTRPKYRVAERQEKKEPRKANRHVNRTTAYKADPFTF